MSGMLRSPCPTKSFGREEYESGKVLAAKCARWMEAHCDGFREIHGYVRHLQATHGKGRVRDRVAAFCVDRGIQVGEDFAFDNSVWAGISRYLVLHDPSLLGDPIRFRKSDMDASGLYEISWMTIDPKWVEGD